MNFGVVQGEIEIYRNTNARIAPNLNTPLVHTWGPSIFSFVVFLIMKFKPAKDYNK